MEESKGGEVSRGFLANPMAADGGGGGNGGSASMDIPEFALCAALVGHQEDVRSLAVGRRHLYSGARDNVVMAWPLDENGHIDGIHTAPAAQITLPDWVNALAVRVSTGQDGEETVVAGCKDGGIYALVWEGAEGPGLVAAGATSGEGGKRLVVKTTLLGHTAPISSLSWSAEGLLLSGSWDETAKAWDLDGATCQWTLGGHENNVCVLGLGPGSIATGSTGLNVDGHLVGQQIRMWQGSPPKETRSLTDHTSGIRDLCLADAATAKSAATASPVTSSEHGCFCSASNDGTVRAWTAEGDCRAVFTIPDDSFVFSVTHLGGGLVASGDDAGNLCACRVPPLPTQTAAAAATTTSSPPTTPPVEANATVLSKHPKTVWSVAALSNLAVPGGRAATAAPSPPSTSSSPAAGGGCRDGAGGAGPAADVATGSADFAVRVFTADADRWLRDDRLKEAEEALGEGGHVCASVSGGGGGGGDGGWEAKLPSVSDMGVMVGAQNGQLSAFVDEPSGAAKVFRWTEAAGGGAGTAKWEPLGTLKPPVRKTPFEGGLYDKVIPVEIESASRGFLMFQLGVNRGDDPKQVADAFCQKHSLGPEYLPQIEQFLLIASL